MNGDYALQMDGATLDFINSAGLAAPCTLGLMLGIIFSCLCAVAAVLIALNLLCSCRKKRKVSVRK